MKVLVVDDTSFIRVLCSYYIKKSNMVVIGECADGDQAVKDISKLQPDCVILDLALPNKNGVEVYKAIQQSYPHIQFIFISALDKQFIESLHPDLPMENFVAKPFDENEIINRLKVVSESLVKDQNG